MVWFGSNFAFGFVAYSVIPWPATPGSPGAVVSPTHRKRGVMCPPIPPGEEWVGWLSADAELYQGSGFISSGRE